METKQIIINAFKANNIQLTQAQAGLFDKYYALLIEYNQKFNLTNITDIYEVATKHFVDSVFGSALIKPRANIIDIGCGAGFPSIPLAIMRPDINITMIDSVGKKIGFIDIVIKELNLKNCTAQHTRAQEFCIKQQREGFDCVVARALAPLNILIELCVPFLKQNGVMLAYKGQNYQTEVEKAENAFSKLFAKVNNIYSYQLIHTTGDNQQEDYSRYILEITKQKQTPKIYPRLKNLIKTNPL